MVPAAPPLTVQLPRSCLRLHLGACRGAAVAAVDPKDLLRDACQERASLQRAACVERAADAADEDAGVAVAGLPAVRATETTSTPAASSDENAGVLLDPPSPSATWRTMLSADCSSRVLRRGETTCAAAILLPADRCGAEHTLSLIARQSEHSFANSGFGNLGAAGVRAACVMRRVVMVAGDGLDDGVPAIGPLVRRLG